MSVLEVWIETAACVTAVLLIPIYMGFIHAAPTAAVAYAGAGGFAMAVGEELQFRFDLRRLTLADVLLWAAAIAGSGGIAYILALILI